MHEVGYGQVEHQHERWLSVELPPEYDLNDYDSPTTRKSSMNDALIYPVTAMSIDQS